MDKIGPANWLKQNDYCSVHANRILILIKDWTPDRSRLNVIACTNGNKNSESSISNSNSKYLKLTLTEVWTIRAENAVFIYFICSYLRKECSYRRLIVLHLNPFIKGIEIISHSTVIYSLNFVFFKINCSCTKTKWFL